MKGLDYIKQIWYQLKNTWKYEERNCIAKGKKTKHMLVHVKSQKK